MGSPADKPLHPGGGRRRYKLVPEFSEPDQAHLVRPEPAKQAVLAAVLPYAGGIVLVAVRNPSVSSDEPDSGRVDGRHRVWLLWNDAPAGGMKTAAILGGGI